MIIIEDLGIKNFGTYSKRMCIAQCKQCLRTSEKSYSQVNGKDDVVCKSCAVSNRHKAKSDYGIRNSRLYSIYNNMKTRCYNHEYNKTKYYMKKGIVICDEWLNDFQSFYSWAMDNGYEDTLTIDRKDNDGNYTPDNCRWVDTFTQAQNRSKLRKDNQTGYTNVQKMDNGMFSSCIVVNKHRFNIGVFNTATEAAVAYNNFVISNGLEHQLNKVVTNECI